jgi:dipeptidyl aminopeptidase/acylaminoacyl peptidase
VIGTMKRKLTRILTICAIAYLVGSALAGILLAELTLHVPRSPLRNENDIRQEYRSKFGANLGNASIVADDGVILRGWYAEPATFNRSSVLLLHGVGDNREGMSRYAELFLSKGYAVLLPDSRAHGESGGSIATYGLRESDDIHRWVEWMRLQSHPSCVYGFGESMGAALVLQALRTEPNLCAVIAESPFSRFRQVALDRVGYYIGVGPWLGRTLARPLIEIAFLYTRARYHVNLLDANPEDAVKNSATPVFLIHGQADKNILPWHSQELASVDPHSMLWIVPRAWHTAAWATASAEFDDRVLTFMNSHSALAEHLAAKR